MACRILRIESRRDDRIGSGRLFCAVMGECSLDLLLDGLLLQDGSLLHDRISLRVSTEVSLFLVECRSAV